MTPQKVLDIKIPNQDYFHEYWLSIDTEYGNVRLDSEFVSRETIFCYPLFDKYSNTCSWNDLGSWLFYIAHQLNLCMLGQTEELVQSIKDFIRRDCFKAENVSDVFEQDQISGEDIDEVKYQFEQIKQGNPNLGGHVSDCYCYISEEWDDESNDDWDDEDD